MKRSFKPIEKGCLAICINGLNSENSGKSVIVGNFLGEVPGFCGNDRWEIDITLRGAIYGTPMKYRQECNLMRIDGYKEQKTSKKEVTA